MILKKIVKKKGCVATSQIILLIVSIIAISYAVGSQVGFVSGQEVGHSHTEPHTQSGKKAFVEESIEEHFNTEGFCLINPDEEAILTKNFGGYKFGFCCTECVEEFNTASIAEKQNLLDTFEQRYDDLHDGSGQGRGQCIESFTTKKLWKVKDIPVDVNGFSNDWCTRNGGDKVCTGSSGRWKLRQNLIKDCTTKAADNPGLGLHWTKPIFYTKALDKSIDKLTTPEVTGVGKTPEDGGKKPPIKEGLSYWDVSAKKSYTAIFKDAAIAIGIYYGGRALLNQIDGISPEFADSFAASAAIGYGVHQTFIPLLNKLSFITIGGGLALAFTGLAVLVTFFFTYKDTKYYVVTFSCFPWGAPSGGENCEECSKQGFQSCNEYQCKSLGRSCELINKGSTQELCFFNNSGDVKPPIIQPWEATLTPGHIYSPDNTISPPDRGVRIKKTGTNECLQPFTPLRFGVTLNEPAKCKISPTRERSFEAMGNIYFGGSFIDKVNHSYTLSIDSPDSLAEKNITLKNGGEFSLFARCEDLQGNSNPANFVFRFCVDEGPDTFPPIIRTTSILNNMPIAFNQTSIDLQVYVNEPAECKWSHRDQSYDNMEEVMTCSANVLELNAQLLYRCSTKLTGLKDRVNNDFYFKCKDQPHLAGTNLEGDRNTNPSSFKFTVVGTRPLVIDSVGPNKTVRDSTDLVKVVLEAKTSAGYKEGEATCQFSPTGTDDSFETFFDSIGTHRHSQDLFLPEGDYTYHIRCFDLGGNIDSKITSFKVESDSAAPIVVRAFHEETFLKLITNEKAECVYGTSSSLRCNYLFEDGIKMKVTDDTQHITNWDPDTSFYIKCQDEFGNRPFPNQCSIIVKPFEV